MDNPPWAKRGMSLNDPAHPGHSTHVISTHGKVARRVWGNPLSSEVRTRLPALCRLNRDEICGFLTVTHAIISIENVHTEPARNFYMEPYQVETALKVIYDDMGSEVLGVWHTHPTGITWPSPRDIAGWPNPELGWRYFLATPTEVSEWELFNS